MGSDWTQPPPTNAPRSTTGGSIGSGHIDWQDNSPPTPKKKTLEFDNLTFTYDTETHLFGVNAPGKETITFDGKELDELKSALVAFGIGLILPGSGVTYR